MKKYAMIHIPFMSFYAGDIYRDVCLHWKGVGFAYLFLLLFICGIPAVIQVHVGFSEFVSKEAPPYVSQIPQITIEDGEAFVDVNQPHTIIDPQTQAVLAIIDTTGAITSLENTEAKVLVTQNQAIVEKSEFETRHIAFDQIEQFTLNQQRINGWLNNLKRYLGIVLFPFMVLGSFVFRVVQVLIYAAIGTLMASWCRSNRSYASLLRLAVVAITPCIITKTVLGLIHVQIPFAGLAYFGVAMAYLFFGVQVSAQEDEDQPIEHLRVDDAGPDQQ